VELENMHRNFAKELRTLEFEKWLQDHGLEDI